MGPLGVSETVFIFVLALLIFGPKKLPELGRTIGKAMTEFRRASSELKATFDREMHAIERDTNIKEVAQEFKSETYNYDSYYDSGAYGSESYDYSAQDSSPVGASATQGADTNAESTNGATAGTETPTEAVETAAAEPRQSDEASESQPLKS
jgi:TatA/E family protein of Tat protein translocase